MDGVTEDGLLEDISKSLAQIYDRNKKEENTALSTKRVRSKKEIDEEVEEMFLGRLVIQPANIKKISRFPLTEAQEKLIVNDFIGTSHCNPTNCTMAMEGKPLTLLVQMDNGLAYMAAMTRTMHIQWPGGIRNEVFQKMENLSDDTIKFLGKTSEQKPLVMADTLQYALYLYPFHRDNDIRQSDFVGVQWKPTVDILNYKPKKEEDLVGKHYKIGQSSFRYLVDPCFLCIIDFPPHMKKIFSEVQKCYDNALAGKTLGKPIYSKFDLDKPPRQGWTIPFDFGEKRKRIEIPETKAVNPNWGRPTKVIAHGRGPLFLKGQNIHTL